MWEEGGAAACERERRKSYQHPRLSLFHCLVLEASETLRSPAEEVTSLMVVISLMVVGGTLAYLQGMPSTASFWYLVAAAFHFPVVVSHLPVFLHLVVFLLLVVASHFPVVVSHLPVFLLVVFLPVVVSHLPLFV